MNSPDYNDLVDIFNLSTPVSPLPSTPVTSSSHDVTMEQSMVSFELLRDPSQIPLKKIDSQRRSRERRPRDPGRVFRRPLMHIDSPRPKCFSTLKVCPCCVSETMVSRSPMVSSRMPWTWVSE
ncbi:hypothetical protein TNCV_4490061 [Trichonephila clavipes]|nr:hypothetical protein TNCV_4490061 [Trichonephila clavipes]